MKTQVLTALVALAWCAPARAQEIEGRGLFAYPSRPDAVQSVVVTARPHTSVRGDLTTTIRTSWPYGESRVRQPVSLAAGSTRSFVVPAPVGPYDSGDVALEDLGARSSISFAGSGSSALAPTFIGVLGLGGRVTAAIQSVNAAEATQARVLAATMLTDPTSGDALLPPFPSAFSGAHAIVAGAGAILALPPEAKRTLRQWVTAGGFLAVAPRTTADLRDPWFTELFGAVTDDGDGHVSGPRLLPRRWGAAVHVGLGVAGVIPYDLSAEGWAHDTRADAALRDFTDFVDGAGGGMIAPGELSLFRRFSRSGDDEVTRAFRPKADVRGLLIPVTLLLTLYIVAVGVALARNRKSRAPLKVFVRLPLAAFAVLAVIVAAARLTRTSASTARVLAVYDLGAGSTEAVERVFAGLNAGVARTFAVAPPGEGLALYATGTNNTSAAMRWDGRALSVERVRLGLWETGLAYSERVVDAGRGIRIARDGRDLRVINESPWTLTDIALLSDGAVVSRLGPAAPGATAVGRVDPPFAQATCEGMFPRATGALDRVFINRMMGPATRARGALQLFALARITDETKAWTRALGFAPTESAAVVRVVIPDEVSDPERVGSYSARLNARRSDYEPDEPAAEVSTESTPDDAASANDAGEGGAP